MSFLEGLKCFMKNAHLKDVNMLKQRKTLPLETYKACERAHASKTTPLLTTTGITVGICQQIWGIEAHVYFGNKVIHYSNSELPGLPVLLLLSFMLHGT